MLYHRAEAVTFIIPTSIFLHYIPRKACGEQLFLESEGEVGMVRKRKPSNFWIFPK